MCLFRLLRKRRPEAVCILGGPNFPHLPELQEQFLAERPHVDVYAYLDGEVGFSNIIESILAAADLKTFRESLKTIAIPGGSHLNAAGRLVAPPSPIRLKELDEIPSPYLLGLMDPFFDGRLSPMIQTNRGCPFQCTFCSDGTALVSKVNHFSEERVRAELTYIGERVPQNIKALFISDLNFGMYARDSNIAGYIADLKKKHDYPHYIDTTTGKNSKRRVINNIEKLSGSLSLSMAVQSLTPKVLKFIKRDNMRLDDFLGLKPAIKGAGLPTIAEVILGLPGESKQSHIDTLDKLLSLELDQVFAYTLMLLNGTELNTPAQRKQFAYETKFRVIPRDFTSMRTGEKVVEVEEVVVGSNTLSFEDYVECRKFVLILVVTNNMGFRPLLHFLLQQKLRVKDLLQRILNALDAAPDNGNEIEAPESLVQCMRDFERDTRQELWDSEEELVAFFQSPDHFQGLLEGKYGANLLQTYRAKIWGRCFDALVDCAFAHAASLLTEVGSDESTLYSLEQIERFCRGRTHNLLGDDRLQSVPETKISYDIESWVNDPDARQIEEFSLKEARLIRFPLTEKQYQLVEEGLNQFGRSDLGRGKVLIRISQDTLWRTPTTGKDFESGQERFADRIPEFHTVATSTKYRV